MKAVFNHYDLQLVVPDFRSSLTDLIIELDYLRKKQLSGSEITNMEKAMSFIDENVKDVMFSRAFVSELHKKVVEGLLPPPKGEGDYTPGLYRTKSVSINRSVHKPPEPVHIKGYMDEMFAFINRKDEPKYDLLKVAIAHHRFLWKPRF